MTKAHARAVRRVAAIALTMTATVTFAPVAGGAAEPSGATVEGTLRVAHGMPAQGTTTSRMIMQASVETGTGTVRLQVGGDRHSELMRLANRKVRIQGTQVAQSEIAADVMAPTGAAPAAPVPASGQLRIAVVLFDAKPTDTFVRRDANEFFFGTGASSVKTAFTNASAGQANVVGTVYGPLVSNMPSADECAFGKWMEKAAGVVGSDYADRFESVVVYSMRGMSCGYGGVAASAPGKGVFMPGRPGWLGVVHEIGHNLGGNHAGSLQCPSAFSPSCPVREYDDPHDRMGFPPSEYDDYFSAYHRMKFGWIPPSGVTTVSSGSQTVTFVTLTQQDRAPADGGQRMLLVDRGDGTNFVVERSARPAAAGRVWVRLNCLAASDSSPCPTALGSDLQFIDMTPSTSSLNDGFLAAGRSFYDVQKKIRIDTVSDPANGDAQVRVCFGCDAVPGVTVYKNGGTIVVEGTSGSDIVHLEKADGRRRVIDANGVRVDAGNGCKQIDATHVRCRGGRFDIRLGDGNDQATVTSRGPTRFDGGAGDDTFVGSRSPDVFVGGSGTDTVDYRGRDTSPTGGGPVTFKIGGGPVSGQLDERDDIRDTVERVLVP